MAYVAHQLAGEARELQKPGGVARLQLADDVAHVAARAEGAPRALDDDTAHLRLVAQRGERVGQLAVDLEGQRVQALRPVERDPRHAAAHLVEKTFWFNHGLTDDYL